MDRVRTCQWYSKDTIVLFIKSKALDLIIRHDTLYILKYLCIITCNQYFFLKIFKELDGCFMGGEGKLLSWKFSFFFFEFLLQGKVVFLFTIFCELKVWEKNFSSRSTRKLKHFLHFTIEKSHYLVSQRFKMTISYRAFFI